MIKTEIKTISINVRGIVQGVGFRPFVYTLALELCLTGFVNNDDTGVNITLQGNEECLKDFLHQLQTKTPPLAQIDKITQTPISNSKTYTTFEITKSITTSNKTTIVSPDIAVCQDCENEMKSKDNHRFEYPLINCTNCGPRYSIINTIPYDRANTSMATFLMCEKCQKEYEDPTNRRYHAQPISCSRCGPTVSLFDNKHKLISNNIEAVKQIAGFINEGKIVAIKGLGGFHLVCDAFNDESVKELRIRKNRPSKPLAVMFENLNDIKNCAIVCKREEEIITSKEKPITLVSKKRVSKLSEYIAPQIDRLGVFIAYTPLHKLLFKYLNNPIVASSANLSDEPIIVNKDELLAKLSHVVDYVLDINREIVNACDDSVVQVVNDKKFVLRQGRGYAPKSLKLPKSMNKKILAVGANQKNTISLAFGETLILSPHIGDLNSLVSLEYFQRTIETFKRFYDFEPDIIVCDKHPSYETTKWAKTQEHKGAELIQIQHHYAHVLSCMAEYNLQEKVLAFSWDGTGYGDDGNIWGGEVFIADNKTYERIHHFKYFKLLGGEKAVKEPKRVGLSLLFDSFSLEEVLLLDNACVQAFSKKEIKTMHLMWQKNLNSPKTSSVGRIFDAVCSLGDFSQVVGYEGESGLLIENEYDENIKECFPFCINQQIDIKDMTKEMIQIKDKRIIASKFINTLSKIILEISKQHPHLSVVLTGGVFQNKTLTQMVSYELDALNRKKYIQYETPLNDGGLSVGQIWSQI